jgi:DNA-binding Xre family transcriptional regulator
MAMSKKIKILLIKRNVTLKELSEKLDTKSSNLSNKLKRDNFSEKELIDIANALDCEYKASFILNDTKEEI